MSQPTIFILPGCELVPVGVFFELIHNYAQISHSVVNSKAQKTSQFVVGKFFRNLQEQLLEESESEDIAYDIVDVCGRCPVDLQT